MWFNFFIEKWRMLSLILCEISYRRIELILRISLALHGTDTLPNEMKFQFIVSKDRSKFSLILWIRNIVFCNYDVGVVLWKTTSMLRNWHFEYTMTDRQEHVLLRDRRFWHLYQQKWKLIIHTGKKLQSNNLHCNYPTSNNPAYIHTITTQNLLISLCTRFKPRKNLLFQR